jgi:hypothetical protein
VCVRVCVCGLAALCAYVRGSEEVAALVGCGLCVLCLQYYGCSVLLLTCVEICKSVLLVP